MRDRGHPDDLLSAFLDDELAEADALAVARHVGACQDCLHDLEELREARTALRSLPDLVVPAAMLDAVPVAAAKAGRVDARRRAVAVATAGFGGLLVVAFVLGGSAPGEVVPPVDAVVIDHVVRSGGGPMIQPVTFQR